MNKPELLNLPVRIHFFLLDRPITGKVESYATLSEMKDAQVDDEILVIGTYFFSKTTANNESSIFNVCSIDDWEKIASVEVINKPGIREIYLHVDKFLEEELLTKVLNFRNLSNKIWINTYSIS